MSSENDSNTQAITASLNYLNCSAGKLSLPAETTLFELLGQCFTEFTNAFDLNDQDDVLSDPSNLERMLSSVFDTESRAFVTEKSLRIINGLDDHDKVSLFVQAVAGMSSIFQRLGAIETGISASLFSKVLQSFAGDEERHEMLEEIETSTLLTSCYTKAEIASYLADIIEEHTSEDQELPVTPFEKVTIDQDEWNNDRPCKKMGLPWGFTIMALN